MYCPHCGAPINDGSAFCGSCGTNLKAGAAPTNPQPQAQPYQPPQQPQQPQYQRPQYQTPPIPLPTPPYQQQAGYAGNNDTRPVVSVGFGEAIALFFRKYAKFNGRATRKEFWFAALFNFIVSLVISIIAAFVPILSFLSIVYALGVLVPGLAICWRRLHDIGKSGVYYLMSLIPIAGPIIVLVFCCKDSVGDNEYGPRKTDRSML